jgi:hypothetical protein
MAQDLYSNLPPEIALQQQGLTRQQEMAKMLLAQGAQQNAGPAGQMVSGHYVPNSFFQNLQGPVNQLLGAYMASKGDEKALELANALREGRTKEQQAIMEKLNTGDNKGALSLASSSQYGGGKEFVPALIGSVIPKTPESVTEYNIAKADGFKGTFNDFKNQLTPYQKAELGLSGARLNLEQQKAAFEMQNGKPLNESQGKAAVFHSQMVGANNELNNVYVNGFNPNNPVAQAQTSMAGGMLNFLTPASSQQAKQAQNQWTEAYLRFKTGAGTNAHEIEANRKTYFPDVGDSPAVIQQKARMREQAQNDIAIAAGPQGARLGVQANPTAPVAPAPTQQTTPSLWGKAEVVK